MSFAAVFISAVFDMHSAPAKIRNIAARLE